MTARDVAPSVFHELDESAAHLVVELPPPEPGPSTGSAPREPALRFSRVQIDRSLATHPSIELGGGLALWQLVVHCVGCRWKY